jgi:hypothetical protein
LPDTGLALEGITREAGSTVAIEGVVILAERIDVVACVICNKVHAGTLKAISE